MKFEFTFHIFGQVCTYDRWKTRNKINMNSLYFVHAGTAAYYYNNEKHLMKPGYLYLIPYSANISFSLENDKIFDHTFFDFYSNPPLKPNNVIEIKSSDYAALDYTVKAISEILSTNRYGDKNNGFWCYYNNENNEFTDIIPYYFNALMILINSIVPIYSTTDERIFNALQYISNNFSREISVSEIASQIFLSENYFLKLFKKHIGKTPHQYIKDYRLDMAATMIESGKSISSAALECGYQSLSSFSYAFKHKLGMSPQEYANRCKQC